MRSAQRDEYWPVYYIEPYEGNEAALGYNLGSSPARLAALRRARDTGAPTATKPVTLVQETERQTGFLPFIPIYGNQQPRYTLGLRRPNLQGYVGGVFRIGDIVGAAFNDTDRDGLEISLHDETDGGDGIALYDSTLSPQTATASPRSENQEDDPNALKLATTFDVLGRTWSTHFLATPVIFGTSTTVAHVASVGGWASLHQSSGQIPPCSTRTHRQDRAGRHRTNG